MGNATTKTDGRGMNGDRRYCANCNRRLFPEEGDICRLCDTDYQMTCQAHEALYGREEREMNEEREESRQDGVEGFWDAGGWHWYENGRRGPYMNATELYIPPDTTAAYEAWGATCGPTAIAALLGRTVDSIRDAFQPIPGKTHTNFNHALSTLQRLGCETAILRKDFKVLSLPATRGANDLWLGRLSLIQFHGSWMNAGVHPGAALSRTHWVAFHHDAGLVYDVNGGPTGDGGWMSLAEWERTVAADLMRTIKGCNGTWSTRGTILVRSNRETNV